MRLNRYCRATATLGLDSIMVMDGCKGLNASFAECLGDDTCPDCLQFADGIEPIAPSHNDDPYGEDEGNAVTNSTIVSSSTVAAQTTQSSASGFSTAVQTTNIPETAVAASTTPAQTPATDSASTTVSVTSSSVAAQTTQGSASGSSTAVQTTNLPEIAVAASTKPAQTTVTESAPTDNASTTVSVTSSSAGSTTTSFAETTAASSSCPDGLQSVEGMPGCCLPEVAYLGDGACDPDAPYNTEECNFDGGDCCKETCNFDTNYGCANKASQGYGPFGYFCLNPDLEEYINPNECTVSDRTRLGDGRCDADYNTEGCNWDGGDCCEETCDPTYAYFECGDAGYDCMDESVVGSTTTTDVTSIVSSTAAADATSTVISSTTSNIDAAEDPSLRVTVAATQMSTIFKNDPDTAHGEDTLQIKGTSFGPNAQDVVLKFIVPASISDPTSAMLRVYSLSESTSGGIFHIAPEDGSWSSNTVTWNNAPDYTTRLGAIDNVEANKWYEVDVTSAVAKLRRKRGPITVRIRSRNPSTAEYSSRKGGNPPELKISYPLESEAVSDAPAVNDVAHHTSDAAGFAGESSPSEQDYTTSNIVTVTSNGMFVSADEYVNNGDGSYYYPVWHGNGESFCTTGAPPTWATGPYLKKTKKQCCDSYFMLKKKECMTL